MEPILRAAADRLIHHGAYLAYVAGSMTEEDLAQRCEATGYTMRQTVAHLVLWLEAIAPRVETLIQEGAGAYERIDADALNAGFAKSGETANLGEMLERLGTARDTLIAMYGRATHARLAEPLGESTVGETIHRWTGHLERHALDIAETLPELRYDPLLLDWALSAQLTNDEEAARQVRLIDEIRTYVASLPDEEEPEDDDGA